MRLSEKIKRTNDHTLDVQQRNISQANLLHEGSFVRAAAEQHISGGNYCSSSKQYVTHTRGYLGTAVGAGEHGGAQGGKA